MTRALGSCSTGSTAKVSACESPKGWRLDFDTGERYPVPCRRLSCPWCGPVTALATVRAIVDAGFDRTGISSVTLPGVVELADARAAGQLIRKLMARMVLDLRSKGYAWQHVAVVELSPAGRPHVHFLQRGHDVPRDVLLAAARSAGAGWTGMDAVRYPSTVARYVLKGALGALDLPPSEAAAAMALHCELNGWRLVSATRAFWRDSEGRPLPGVRVAREAARVAWQRGWRP